MKESKCSEVVVVAVTAFVLIVVLLVDIITGTCFGLLIF